MIMEGMKKQGQNNTILLINGAYIFPIIAFFLPFSF